jgi:hypothetical protein
MEGDKMYKITVKDSANHETWYERQGFDTAVLRDFEELKKRNVLGAGYDIIMTYNSDIDRYTIGSINQFSLREDC